MVRSLWIIQTEAGDATVGGGKWYGDGDDDDAGSDISLHPLNEKGIYAEGPFLDLDWLNGGVPVAAEIMLVQARVSGK